MPQVDLHPLFPPTSHQASITPPTDGSGQVETPPKPSNPKRSLPVTTEQVTNVAFVIAACLGALISAAFLFKGGEVFQEVAAWPRELFYGRPSPVLQGTAANRGAVGANGSAESSPSPSDTGDPFSPTGKLLNLDPLPTPSRPNNGPSGSPFSSPSNLDRLNTISPANDSLSRGLMQGTTPSMAQTPSSGVGKTVGTPQTGRTSAAQTAAVAKRALRATSRRTSSVKTSRARRLSAARRFSMARRLSAAWSKLSTVQKSTVQKSTVHKSTVHKSTAQKSRGSVKGHVVHSSFSSYSSDRTERTTGSLFPQIVSREPPNVRSVGEMGHGPGGMNARGVAGMGGGGVAEGHSFGGARGR